MSQLTNSWPSTKRISLKSVFKLFEKIEADSAPLFEEGELERLVKSATREEVTALLRHLVQTHGILRHLSDKIQRLTGDQLFLLAEEERKARRSAPSLTTFPVANKPQQPKVPAPSFVGRLITKRGRPSQRHTLKQEFAKGSVVFGGGPVSPEVSKPKQQEFHVNYFDERSGRIAGLMVTPQQYIRLWEKGLLQFQHERTVKPEKLPTLEEARARL